MAEWIDATQSRLISAYLESKKLVCEASDVGLKRLPNIISITSYRTGRTTVWTADKFNRDAEGDIGSVEYTSPVLPGWTLHVIND